jgi:hypothetical protein
MTSDDPSKHSNDSAQLADPSELAFSKLRKSIANDQSLSESVKAALLEDLTSNDPSRLASLQLWIRGKRAKDAPVETSS